MKPVYTYGVSRPSTRIVRFRTMAALLILMNLSSLLSPSIARAEGTAQVQPVWANGTGLVVSTTGSFPLGNVGSYLTAPADQRLYIHIKDFNAEKLYYGFHWETLSPSLPIDSLKNIYMRIYDPNDNEVARILLPTTGPGWIPGSQAGWQQACIGPSIAGSSGYNPLIFAPTMNGDYYVEFYQSTDGGASHPTTGESILSKYFDLTVVSAGKRLKGRVHCNEWCFSVYNPNAGDIQDPKASTNASFVGYTPDSTSVMVKFPSSGFKPLTYIVAFNSFGVQDNGNWIQDRKSITLKTFTNAYLKGGFDVFLTLPDASVYPAGQNPSPPVLLAPVIAGCPPGPYDIRFKAPQPGDYYMLLDLNGVAGFQNHTADRYIELAGQSAGIISYQWDGKDGLGNVVPANTTFPIIFSFRKGRINIPFYDVELNVSGFEVDGLAPSSSVTTNAILYWDDTQLSAKDANCGNNSNNTTDIGYDNSVVGVKPVWPATPAVPTFGRAWNGNGNPTNVTPAPAVSGNDADNSQCNDYGNGRLLNTWAWGITQESTQTITLQCVTVSGHVWNDADGSANGGFPSNIQTILPSTGQLEPGVNAGGTLYANLVDPITNNVLYSIPVDVDGSFTLLNCPVNASGMLVYITTSQVANGSPVAAAATPSDWTGTSPLIRPFNSGTGLITGIDFGIERLPNSDNQTYTIAQPVLNSMLTLNGAGTIASPGPLHGSDPEDGLLTSNKTIVITSVPSNEQLYYNGALVTNNMTITNYDPTKLQMKFTTINSVTVTSFTYAYLDAAGKQDPTPAVYTINMSVVLANALNSFTGRGSDYGNVLNWTGYEEVPGAYYILQRSTDGNNFTDITKVDANGNGTTVSHSYTDKFSSPNSPTYYRLEWTDGNGNLAFSNVVTISASAGSAMLDVSPNPFKSQVTVRLNLARAERVAIRLLDSRGMLLKQAQYQGAKGSNSFQVSDLSSLPPSVYFVQILLADQVFVKKVFN